MHQSHSKQNFHSLFALTIGALGVVYGDIGTLPLYAVNEIMFGHAHLHLTKETILGAISLVLWALTLAISFKYITFVLRADSDGEGGVFALYSLIYRLSKRGIFLITILLILAAGLLFGDGIITPAISVLSAVEGINVATSAFQSYTVPLTIGILTLLFAIQSKGTHHVGKIFGPVVILWFLAIGIIGFMHVSKFPEILLAFNPVWAIHFLTSHSLHEVFTVLGSVMLVITGGEAMYADMGHFGKLPIRLSWFIMVYPALMLNYLGQGAYILGGQQIVGNNLFYSTVPQGFLYPMVVLATLATVIASQALISGCFSLMSQAITLGLFPYMKIKHTHYHHEGQIYIPTINWVLYVGCVLLVIGFGSSSRLASAYGLAVSGVMFMTSITLFFIARYYWKWSRFQTLLFFLPLTFIDFIFLSANSLKILEGGFIPLIIGFCCMCIMLIWRWGRKKISNTYNSIHTMTVKELIQIRKKTEAISSKSIVILTPQLVRSAEDRIPLLKQLIWERYGILPMHTIFLTIVVQKTPHMHHERFHIYNLYNQGENGSIVSVQVNFGFMEELNIETVLEDLAKRHLVHISENPSKWIIEALHERIHAESKMGFLSRIKFHIFHLFSKVAATADQYFGLGDEIHLSVEVIPVRF